jgi:phosphotransferase system HPr (HPr) family protein
MLRTMRLLAGLGSSRTLLKTAVRGGLVRLSAVELSYGEGVLGTRNQRRAPVGSVLSVEIEESPAGRGAAVTIRFTQGEPLALASVNPLAARRLRDLVAALQGAAAPPFTTPRERPMHDAVVRIAHESGLHARPLAAFVKLAKGFEAEIKVQNMTTGKGPVNGKSPVHLLMLTAQQGHELRITASGADAEAALAALVGLVAADFAQEGAHDGH